MILPKKQDTTTPAISLGTTVTSPVNGVVGAINFRQGSLANNTTVLTTVSNISNVVAYFSVNEKELLSLLKEFKGTTQAEKIKNMPELSLILADGTVYACRRSETPVGKVPKQSFYDIFTGEEMAKSIASN